MAMLFRRERKRQYPAAEDSGPTPNDAPLDKTEAQQDMPRPSQITPDEEKVSYPEGIQLVMIMVSVFVSMFLVALDRLIISTAIPVIADEFHSLPDIGWYGSAYLLTTCAFQLLFRKVSSFSPVKGNFLATIFHTFGQDEMVNVYPSW
ncbi:uncharacterized protein F4822DRAFT_179775 [Hypoxylon trugodes]|uniref:uncharacterized protein n=1 Tax=Hypoxylon trugodes TaxID=326681 RepID=UPI00218FDF5D|nr:uncharacterized protein F4822DRAFT_179775 [Hypoxylon trugodes]KAI1391258.1 hypothetical protein F4822DRAFT_179775 [Hypoxylon trugodes]